MNKRIDTLKRIAIWCRNRKLPKRLIIVIMTVSLIMMYIFNSISDGLKKLRCLFRPDMKKVLLSVTMGIILGLFVLPHSYMKLDDEKAYGNVNTDTYSEAPAIYDIYGKSNQSEVKYYTEEELLNMSFYIKVNRLMNCVTIYTTDDNGEYTVPIKTMICSTGGEETPLGIYGTKQKYIFRKLLFDVYGQYATRIEGQILFHSVSYANGYKDTLIAEEFNKLGLPVSHGCIRLTTEDAKWIYDYCKEGTIVEIYEDENPGPLGKPEMIKVPEDTVWDPTDVDPANPWNGITPVIEAEDICINIGEQFDALANVKATDTCGNDITDRIVVSGNVDTSTEGIYEITYSVNDLIRRSATKTINVVVKGSE
ncbi:MAG: L,D-transpeptidase family protein [Lachnospiraceae bacterium]|nr:L,D-transpeptidase family protein [Lachnospiraceae bacterium]